MKYTILLLFVYAGAFGQQMPEYVVYMVKGDVTSNKAKAEPVKVKQNQLLYTTETLTLKQGAEITLANKEGVSLVLTVPKSYSVASLAKQKKPATENVSQKYLHLLFHELLDPNHDYNKFRKQNAGGVWGGVQRSGECGNLLFPTPNMKSAELKLPFKWRKTNDSGHYLLKVYDEQAKEIASVPVNDTSALIDLSNYITRPGKYYWRVASNSLGCEDELPLTLHIISREDESKIESAFQKNSSSLMNQLAAVEMLEKENMIWAAKKYLEELFSKNSDTVLGKTYSWFLLKYHFEEEAQKIWQRDIDKNKSRKTL